ncbi:hypothetical protein [Cytobacillus solani]|uniref:Uncharacterized protein n=1 Tax=Cytobacillus solani TaxID=1637975 RepID=A0A0Q3SH75_9BACI|nr:hypothetical protein [Cytobacillus solani]KQL18836.1 hypothetical protein AN957_09810 [Cytobacillus solani]
MTKIHVIKDESLGGIEREYVEVDRKADVGDKIIINNKDFGNYENGDVFTVIGRYDESLTSSKAIGVDAKETDVRIRDYEYQTLEPTDIVHIDGARYRMVERKAEVGENVLIVHSEVDGYGVGDDFEALAIFAKTIRIIDIGGGINHVEHYEYRVLVPADKELLTVDEGLVGVDHSQASPQVLDLLANLASRLTTLEQHVKNLEGQLDDLVDRSHRKLTTIEQQLRDTQANVERQAEELAKLEKRVDQIITNDLGWKQMGPGRIPNIEIKVSAIKSEVGEIADKLAELLDEIDGGVSR